MPPEDVLDNPTFGFSSTIDGGTSSTTTTAVLSFQAVDRLRFGFSDQNSSTLAYLLTTTGGGGVGIPRSVVVQSGHTNNAAIIYFNPSVICNVMLIGTRYEMSLPDFPPRSSFPSSNNSAVNHQYEEYIFAFCPPRLDNPTAPVPSWSAVYEYVTSLFVVEGRWYLPPPGGANDTAECAVFISNLDRSGLNDNTDRFNALVGGDVSRSIRIDEVADGGGGDVVVYENPGFPLRVTFWGFGTGVGGDTIHSMYNLYLPVQRSMLEQKSTFGRHYRLTIGPPPPPPLIPPTAGVVDIPDDDGDQLERTQQLQQLSLRNLTIIFACIAAFALALAMVLIWASWW